jgi:Na+/H+-dicarboxylate symporter
LTLLKASVIIGQTFFTTVHREFQSPHWDAPFFNSLKVITMQALEVLNPASLKQYKSKVMALLESKLWAKVLLGMVLGVITGILVSQNGPFGELLSNYKSQVSTITSWLAFPGKLFLKAIQMVIMPLILASIIMGLASARDAEQLRRLGLRFTTFVVLTSVVASSLAIFLSRLINPGAGMSLDGAQAVQGAGGPGFSLKNVSPDLLLDILPANPLASIVQGQMLEVVVIAVIGGISLLSLKTEQAKSVLGLLEAVQNICMIVIGWAMRLAPYAVYGLMTQVASTIGLKALESMGKYVFTAFTGFILIISLYVLTVWVLKRKSPIVYLRQISEPMLLAFSTSSSAATMPLTMQVAEDKLNVEPSVARFLIPLGTTVNMAGSAIWQTSAVIFIGQVYQVDFSIGQIGFVVMTAVVSAIGSPGVPGVGVGILAVVLGKLGIPLEGISLILGVDRLIDMGCTVVNVAGDLTACELLGGKSGANLEV